MSQRLAQHLEVYGTRVRVLALTVGFADLTAAAVSEALSMGTPPVGSRVLGRRVGLTTPFTGGGASSCAVSVGPTADPNKIVASADVFAAAVDGEASALTAGISPNADIGGVEQFATFTADVNVADLTAGACLVEIFYADPTDD